LDPRADPAEPSFWLAALLGRPRRRQLSEWFTGVEGGVEGSVEDV